MENITDFWVFDQKVNFFKRVFFCVIRHFYDHIHVQKSNGSCVEILKCFFLIFRGRFDGYINFQMWGRFYGYKFKSKPTTLLNLVGINKKCPLDKGNPSWPAKDINTTGRAVGPSGRVLS